MGSLLFEALITGSRAQAREETRLTTATLNGVACGGFFLSSLSLNSDFAPLEAHLILWGIEQSLMPRETGKRWEWEIARAAQDELVERFQDYDWADEVLHAQIGRKWLLPEFGTRGAMLSAWEHLIERWRQSLVALRARSAQEEWWPAFMAEVRRHQQQSRPVAEKSG